MCRGCCLHDAHVSHPGRDFSRAHAILRGQGRAGGRCVNNRNSGARRYTSMSLVRSRHLDLHGLFVSMHWPGCILRLPMTNPALGIDTPNLSVIYVI